MGIKEQLREGLRKRNILGIEITRPNQELIIMRGIPGAGKSTESNKLVGEGIIHSTDSIIEATGDYAGHFARMAESNDWSAHGRMHKRCFLDAKESMKEGVSPVIVDNTNIKAKEARNYVEAALKLGLDENNITVVDVGDGGCTAEVLAERNTHNVPLKVVKRMMQSHASVGELTVAKILETKGYESKSNVLYSAVVLDDKSRTALIQQFASMLPEGWKTIAHHMTIVFGKGIEDKTELGKEVVLNVVALGASDKALAVRVSGYPTTNKIPHVTVAVNDAGGGKPFDSNSITDWGKTELGFDMKLYGVVTDIPR